jgi:serine phosphatase RsbU (regulator of sigma subunit)
VSDDGRPTARDLRDRLGEPIAALLAESHDLPPDRLGDAALHAARAAGADDVEVYLVDYSRKLLVPLRRWVAAGRQLADDEVLRMDATMAGRAFMSGSAVEGDVTEGVRRWVPMMTGAERMGVREVTLPSIDADGRRASDDIAALLAELLLTKGRHTDAYVLARRRGAMSLTGEMQWHLLPPLTTRTPAVEVAGVVEPAYDPGGDAFDYSLNGDRLDLTIFDAVGHDLSASQVASVVMASLRHSRRHGVDLADALAAADQAVVLSLPRLTFATAHLARLDLATGRVRWVNAGHPLPLLVREARVVSELSSRPRAPIGLGHIAPADAAVGEIALQPGDRLLYYSDGVIDGGRRSGEPFGLHRLTDLLQRAVLDKVDCAETVRRLGDAVLGHAAHQLHDDATLLLVEWRGADRGTA